MAETFRATSRVLLFDESDRVLLFLQYGKTHEVAARWMTPGGGVDPGESFDDAAVREVEEETGLVLESVPSPFWGADFDPDQRWHVYTSGHFEWYALRVANFEPRSAGWTDDEKVDILEHRWWGVDELADSGEVIEPDSLIELLRQGLATLPRR
jgi:8-oxo-dGTP pyrophosphatase MutT (NUDIX family)